MIKFRYIFQGPAVAFYFSLCLRMPRTAMYLIYSYTFFQVFFRVFCNVAKPLSERALGRCLVINFAFIIALSIVLFTSSDFIFEQSSQLITIPMLIQNDHNQLKFFRIFPIQIDLIIKALYYYELQRL